VLRYIWDTEEQEEIIAGIVNGVVATDREGLPQHPRASASSVPDADEIYKEVTAMAEKWAQPGLPMAERTLIKDRLRYLDGRCEWISNEVQRRYVQGPIDQLWQKILQTA
jgi:MoxR-like ATPase